MSSAIIDLQKGQIMEFHNKLTPAELERLAILAEKLGYAQLCIGKILRHGYLSGDPATNSGATNRDLLEEGLGHVLHAAYRLCDAEDLSQSAIRRHAENKAATIEPWLHHQVAADDHQ